MLKQSKNPKIQNLYKATAPKNIEANTILHQDKARNPKDRLVNKTVNKRLDDIKGLKEQNTIIDFIWQQCSCSSINQWQKVCEGLPQNIFIFVCKAIILQLANNTNLFRWKKVVNQVTLVCVTLISKHNWTCYTTVPKLYVIVDIHGATTVFILRPVII